jgi:Raf kinase inhibitor-like YbhB/YbcL family protein
MDLVGNSNIIEIRSEKLESGSKTTMNRLLTLILLGVGLSSLSIAAAITWRQQATQVEVTGHVYETAKLEPTDERTSQLKAPEGFKISRFALLSNPRMIAVNTDGTVYVSQREPGTVSMLRDTDQDGIADVQKVVAEKKDAHGLAIHNGKLYLATIKEIFVGDIKPDGSLGEFKTLITDLPDGGQHPNRTLAVGPDEMLYITVGSDCNACKEPNEEHATILRAKLDGGDRKVFASGLRNTIGFGWHPASRRLFGMDHGIDWLGDNEQSEELNELTEGARYGWPYVYADGKIIAHPKPPTAFTPEMWKKMSKEPVLLYTPHSAPMQMTFYTGGSFPAEYKNDAFVAMRGSWNRNPPSGYEVIRIRFDPNGQPTKIEPFLSAFLIKGGAPDGKDGHIARLAGLGVATDGSLLVGDDANGVIYRVSYGGGKTVPQRFPQIITSALPEISAAASTIKVSSKSFTANNPIPEENSSYGADQSPHLSWSGAPKETKSLVLMVEDPDATSPKPFVHWLAANIAPEITEFTPSLPKSDQLADLNNALQGANNTSKVGWYGPRPPAGEPPHHYHFQIFALDRKLDLKPGFNRQTLLAAMKGHVLAKGELIGVYQRK